MSNPVLAGAADFQVLTKPQFLAVAAISEDTLNRLHAEGKGPERVQLSPRRIGYTVGAIRKWLQSRTESSAA